MGSSFLRLGFLLLAGLAAGCTTLPSDAPKSAGEEEGRDKPSAVSEAAVVGPFAEPLPPVGELSEEIVFSTLAGEVALQRGEFATAYDYQMEAAELAGDAEAAERATRIAIHSKEREKGLVAAGEWVRLAPNSLAARQLLASLLLAGGELEASLEQLQAIVKIAEAKGEDGFMHVVAALSREIKQPEAIDLVRRVAAEYPDDPRSHYAVVLSALLAKDLETAQSEAERLIARFPRWYKSYLLLSRIQLARSDDEAARRLLADAAERFPDEREVISAYVKLLMSSQEYDSAYKHLLRLYEKERDDEEVNYWLAMLAMEFNRDAEAGKYLSHLYGLGKRKNAAAFYLGVIAERGGDQELALGWFRKVADGELRFQAQIAVVRILGERGEVDEARNQLQALRIAMPEHSVELYLAEVELLREHGGSDQVIALFAQALATNPDNEDLLYARALFAVTIDRMEILEQDLARVLEINPDNADALNALGYTLADKTDRIAEAYDYIRRALELKPDAPAIMDSMGWVLYRMGRHDESLRYLRQAFEALPDAEIAAHYGEVLWVQGERKQARKIWRDALEQTPDSPHLLEVLKRFK